MDANKIKDIRAKTEELAALILDLSADPKHSESPHVAPMRSRALALADSIEAHEIWLAGQAAAAK